MAGYLRLRQICLVAPHLEPVIADIAAIMGLDVCYRDGNVAKYGLENALLPVDTILLEVVAPFRAGTAAGRFLDKTGGRGGYMAIFCCDDPDARGKHADDIGVRTANVIDARALSRRATASARLPRRVHRVQPHRRQRRCPRPLSAGRARLAEIDPQGCDAGADRGGDAKPGSAGVGRALGQDHRDCRSARTRSGEAELKLPNCSFRFVEGDSEIMSGLSFGSAMSRRCAMPPRRGAIAVSGDAFLVLAGVTFQLVA